MRNFVLAASLVHAASAAAYYHSYPGRLNARDFRERRHRQHASRLLRAVDASGGGDTGENAAVVSPAAFGADATGTRDSSDALRAAIDALTRLGTGTRDEQDRLDLGGAVLDLEGGIYSVSETVRVPSGYANFKIQRGSLLARANFSAAIAGPYLLKVGDAAACG